MKKYLRNTSLLLVCTIIIFSCKHDNNNSNEIKLTFWHSFVANTHPALNKLLEKYESENPNINIVEQYVPSGDPLVQKLITAIQSGTTPDLAWVHTDFLDKLVQADAIYRMEKFINGANGFTEEEFNDFFPQLISNAKWNDILYAIPMEATTIALLYNKDLYKKVGLDPNHPPRDWEELKEYALKLTFDSSGDGKMNHYGFYVPALPASGALSIWMLLQWEPFLWQAGGEFLNKDQTKAMFNRKPGVQALTLWKELYEEIGFESFSMTHDMGFISQTCAMIMDGPWDLPSLRKINNFEWGIAPLPEGPDKRATYVAGEHLTIFKKSDHPDEAWKFIKWFTSPEIQAEFSIESGYMPVRKSTLELQSYKDYLKTDPYLAAFVEQFEIGYARQNITYKRVEINQRVAEAIERSLKGNVDPKTALDAAAEQVNSILKKVNNR
ncbi:MAG: ABC transporter substrate-binding protein [Melioribacteraceae bacterium]|nr:ABC transporter substrate-binding protein [Melioribacteraceae bacterium]MCF8265172.1 ABC transporter substrate-binding protein [Melioribacteraceae bacterium]MCF8412339.1 ABC transporter substrate-binding protein [Melioribacteraceae bacterium]